MQDVVRQTHSLAEKLVVRSVAQFAVSVAAGAVDHRVDALAIRRLDETAPVAPRHVFENKKAQLSLTNPRDACEKFARFT